MFEALFACTHLEPTLVYHPLELYKEDFQQSWRCLHSMKTPLFSFSIYYQVVDVGGSMFVHAFGAYFGLAAARVLYKEDVEQSSKEGSVYHSDIFAMIGKRSLS